VYGVTPPPIVVVNFEVWLMSIGLGDAENAVIVRGSGLTTNDSDMLAVSKFASVTVALTEYVPNLFGVQDKELVLVERHPGGSPA
jgi:hypothetical protein